MGMLYGPWKQPCHLVGWFVHMRVGGCLYGSLGGVIVNLYVSLCVIPQEIFPSYTAQYTC